MSAGQMRGVGVEHHQFGERVIFELGEEVKTRQAAQVVEPVAVLQVLELRLEHKVEGRAEQTAERHLLLGEPADPEVDMASTTRWSPQEPFRNVEAVERFARHGPPRTSSVAAARLSASVVALVMEECVP